MLTLQTLPTKIVKTLCGRMFAVRDAGPGLDHVFEGIAVKRVPGGFAPKAKACAILVRRAGTRIVRAEPMRLALTLLAETATALAIVVGGSALIGLATFL